MSAAVPVGEAFFAVAPCTAGANTVATPCEARAGSTILSHNPAETGDCPLGCEPGWRVDKNFHSSEHAYTSSWAPCPGVTVLDAQSLAQST